jgi:hypothetical protein
VRVDADLSRVDRLVELLDLVDLVVLVLLPEEVERLRDVHLALFERDILLHHRLHPLFDLREVVRLERTREVEVVVEAIGHGRPEAELRFGEELEDRAGHHVRGRVAQRVEGIRSVVRLAGHRSCFRHLVLLVMWPSLGRDHSRGSTQLPRCDTRALIRRRSAVVSFVWIAPASTVPARSAIVRRGTVRVVALGRY